MNKVRFIIDSTFGVAPDYLKKYQIVVNPLHVIIDGKDYLDDVDIKLYDVMDAVMAGKKVSTSRPTPESFLRLYDQLFSEGAEQIFCVTISSHLSSTVESAVIARNEHPRKDDIFVHDSLAVHSEAVMILESAIRAVEMGKRGQEVIDIMLANLPEGGALMSLQTLDVLYRSGRLSRFKTIIGNILHVKPIVLFRDNKLEVIKKVRSDQKVYEFFAEYVNNLRRQYPGKLRIRLTHVNTMDRVRALKKVLEEKLPDVEITIGLEITSVLAIHIAYGGIGMCWIFEQK